MVGAFMAGKHFFSRDPFLKQTEVYGNISLVYVQSLWHPMLRATGSLARKEYKIPPTRFLTQQGGGEGLSTSPGISSNNRREVNSKSQAGRMVARPGGTE